MHKICQFIPAGCCIAFANKGEYILNTLEIRQSDEATAIPPRNNAINKGSW